MSPQFSDCVNEFVKRKRLLVVSKNRYAFQTIFYTYHKFNKIEENKEILKNSVIRFIEMKTKETNIGLKYVSKRCKQLKVLAIDHQIKGKQIKALNKFSKRVDTLCLGEFLLSYEDLKIIEIKVEKIGSFFGNTIKCLYLKFANGDKNTSHKLIALLKKFSKLEEFKVFLLDSIDEVIQYIPKTLRVLDTFNGYFENETQYRQDFKDMIQRTEDKFTVFRMYYPLDKELLELMKLKLDVKNFAIDLCDIPIDCIFQILLLQKKLHRLIITWKQIHTLKANQDLSREYRFSRVQHLSLRNIKVNEQNLKAIIKCFPNISTLFLGDIEFICECNLWSVLCLHCSNQCVDVLTKLVYLRKLHLYELKSYKFPISSESLEKFPQLCQIKFYSIDFDIKGLVENVKQFCAKRRQTMFYLRLKTTPEKITELSQNIPKNLCIKKIF